MTEKTLYTVTLTDAVQYQINVAAESQTKAESKAHELWDNDFLRFTPIDDGSINIISIEHAIEGLMPALAGGAA